MYQVLFVAPQREHRRKLDEVRGDRALVDGPYVNVFRSSKWHHRGFLSYHSTNLIKDLIPASGLVVVWGPPKSGKSLWALDAVMHVALGWEYRGRRVREGPVVYCAMEGLAGYGARLEAFRQRHLKNHNTPVPFYLVGSPMTLVSDRGELVAQIKLTLGNAKPVTIVLDTLNRSIGGSESDDRDMAAYIRAVDALSAQFGCAVIIVHHCGVDTSRPRGHTSLTGAADAQLSVQRDRAGTITVTVEYTKDGAEGDQVFSSLEVAKVGQDQDGEPITSCVLVPANAPGPKQSTKRKLTDRQRRALDVLTDCITKNGQSPPANLGLPNGTLAVTVSGWRSDMLSRGVIDPNGKNPRTAFNQIKTSLAARKLIDERDDLVWKT
jgi:hypothetical protein